MGLANKAITPRLSKSIDMRFHWLQDRMQRNQFRVEHVAGRDNIADFSPRLCHGTSTINLPPFAPWILATLKFTTYIAHYT